MTPIQRAQAALDEVVSLADDAAYLKLYADPDSQDELQRVRSRAHELLEVAQYAVADAGDELLAREAIEDADYSHYLTVRSLRNKVLTEVNTIFS